MNKIFGTLAGAAVAVTSIAVGALPAHATTLPTGGDSDAAGRQWGQYGCFLTEANTPAHDFAHADGFHVQTSNTIDAPVPATDATALQEGYDREVTAHKVYSADEAMHDVSVGTQYESSRVHETPDVSGQTQDDVAVVSITNTLPAKPGQVLLTQDQLDWLGNQAENADPNAGPYTGNVSGRATGITLPKGGFVSVDKTVAIKSGVTDEQMRADNVYTGLALSEAYGFLDTDPTNCAIVTDVPKQTAVPGADNDQIAAAPPHTTVASDSGWVDGKRTIVYDADVDDSIVWLFHNPAQDVQGATSFGFADGSEPIHRRMQVVYTEGKDPVVTTTTARTPVTTTTMVDKQVTKAVTVTTGLDSVTLVQADTYLPNFAAGTWDGKRQRKHAEQLTTAQRATLEALDDDGVLKPREDRALWGASTHKVVAVTGSDVVKYGSLLKAAEHDAGMTEDVDVKAVEPGQVVHKLWVLGAGADAAHPFGSRLTVSQTDVGKAASPVKTVTKQVTTTVKVPVTTTTYVDKQVTTTTPGTTVDPVVTYPQPMGS